MEVARLVRMTTCHAPTDPQAALLSDADLSVLGQVPGRYHVYLRDVRLDYDHLDAESWRIGRLAVVESLLAADPLFHTPAAVTSGGRRPRQPGGRAGATPGPAGKFLTLTLGE
ncbi:hypothetical protein [Tessaracoccus coleopterorum]|uniref:hypothetical protein n=1 Tax=Tessaracoccus coleopterorum TaxID=2714950 RepID=UPI0018D477BC|nr:hypothetical protein [Tessaracoccus coleopterorum]